MRALVSADSCLAFRVRITHSLHRRLVTRTLGALSNIQQSLHHQRRLCRLVGGLRRPALDGGSTTAPCERSYEVDPSEGGVHPSGNVSGRPCGGREAALEVVAHNLHELVPMFLASLGLVCLVLGRQLRAVCEQW